MYDVRVLISVIIDTRQEHYLMGHRGTAQLDMYARHLCTCYQYMPLAQHEPLRFETLCYIIMHNAVQCITLQCHHIMVSYRSLYLMMLNPFVS